MFHGLVYDAMQRNVDNNEFLTYPIEMLDPCHDNLTETRFLFVWSIVYIRPSMLNCSAARESEERDEKKKRQNPVSLEWIKKE